MKRATAGTSTSLAGGPRPFRFLRHGVGLADELKLWVVVDGSAQPLADAFLKWRKGTARVDGPTAELTTSGWKAACGQGSTSPDVSGALSMPGLTAPEKRAVGTHARLDAVLLEVHEKTPLALVVRENRVKSSAWHTETMSDPQRVLQALKRAVQRPGEYVRERPQAPRSAAGVDMREVLLEVSRGSVPAELVEATLEVLWQSADKAGRAVLHDLMVDELPGWFGADFDCDIVLREALAVFGGLSSTTIAMPKPFETEVQRRMAKQQRESSARVRREDAVDWTKLVAVQARLVEENWTLLESGFDETTPAHVETLLQLSDEQRRLLARKGHFGTRLANAGVYRMMAGDFAGALTLYDAALESTWLDAMAAANPLYAVCDGNNKLGVNAKRAPLPQAVSEVRSEEPDHLPQRQLRLHGARRARRSAARAGPREEGQRRHQVTSK